MNVSLSVFHAERRIGWLRHDEGDQAYSFEYDPAWCEFKDGFDLAPLLSRKQLVHEGTAVKFFFSNLLPEGEMLEIVSKSQAVSKYNPFGLLKKIGAECAGALKILPDDTSAADGRTYKKLSLADLSACVRDGSGNVLANIRGKLRMSLAGVQDKLPALVDHAGQIFLPEVGSASTHILKPNHRDAKTFPHTVVNEHFCMTLAHKMGLKVPRSFLIAVPEKIYAVERFDRVFGSSISLKEVAGGFELEGNAVQRRHQIDVCQLLGLPPTQKYEEPEYQTAPGPGILAVAEAISEASGQALSTKRSIIDWVVFNYLIGNSDSHAKNVSLLWDAGRWALAPAYDLVSVAVYSGDQEKLHDFAFSIGGETRYSWITANCWNDFAKSMGVNYRYLAATLSRMARAICQAAPDLLAEMLPDLTEAEGVVLKKITALIEVHAGYANDSAKSIPGLAPDGRGSKRGLSGTG